MQIQTQTIKNVFSEGFLNLILEFKNELNKNAFSNEYYNDNGEYNFIKWLKDFKNISLNINEIFDLNKVVCELSFYEL